MTHQDAVGAAIAALEDIRRHEENLNKKVKDLESKLADLRVKSAAHIEKLQLELEDERMKRKTAEDKLQDFSGRTASKKAATIEGLNDSLQNGDRSKRPSPQSRWPSKNSKRLRSTVEDAEDEEPLLKRPKHKDAEYLIGPLQSVKTKSRTSSRFTNTSKVSKDVNATVKDIYGLRPTKAQHKPTDLIKVSTLPAAKVTTIANAWNDIKDDAVDKTRKQRFRSWLAGETVGCAYNRVTLGQRTQWHGEPFVACQLCRDAKQPCFRKTTVTNHVVELPGSKDSHRGQEFNYF